MQSLEAGFCVVQQAEAGILLYCVTALSFLKLRNNTACRLALLAVSHSQTLTLWHLQSARALMRDHPQKAYHVIWESSKTVFSKTTT